LADYQAVGTGELGKRLYAYDVFGNKRYMDNELLERTSYSYDDKNQLIRIDHPTDASFKDSNNNGNAARYELYDYDEAGRRIKHTRAWGVSASTNDDISELTYYDDIGRVKQVKSFGGITTSYRYIYDPIGGGSTVIATQGDGKTLTDTKDYFSRLLAHTDLGGHSFTYTYNKAGWLTHQQGDTNLAVAGLEQNIDFTYYHNGYLQEVVDHGVNTHARYEYDENGNRTFEGYYQETDGAVYYQWSKATYDQLNRVTQIDDAKYNLTYEYDANGNRRHVYARYHDGLQGNVQIQDYWYKYDAHNRFVVTKGTYSDTVINADGSHTWNRGSGTISAGTDGYAITYNVASQRTTANNESYIYTKDGLLAEVRIDGVLRAKRFYDAVGNVKDYYEYGTNGTTVTRQNHYTYTPDSQVNTENDGSITSTYYYDSAGTLLRVYSPQSGATINTLYAYEYWDSAKTKQIKISGTVTAYDPNLPWKPGFSDFTYDVNGHLTQVNDYGSDGVKNTGDDRYLNYKLDSNGLILQRNELIGNISSRTQRYYYLNGHGVGDAGGFGASHMDYVSLLASRDQEADKSGKPVSSADFDYNYQPINDQYPATTPGTYSVRAGDTLQSIAMAVWGDQSMWYLIADANGLSSNPTLIENQVLVIPNVVANIHNNASTFKVYNPGEIIGDTTPTLPDPPPPPPEDEKCGAFGQILPIIVQAVVTAFYGPIAGNIAGQLTGMATGVQDKFSWSSLATASIMPDIDFFPGIDNAVLNQAANAAVQNAATQGVAILFGEQEKFSWKAVAASAIAAPITSKIDQMLGTSPIKTGREFSWGQLGANMASEFLKSATRQAANIVVNRGGKMEWSNVAVDTLGYGIGHSLADQITYNRTEAARQERLREQIKRDLASGLFTNQQATQQELADRLFGAPEDRFAAFGGPGVSLIDIPLSDSGGSTGDAELAELAARLTQSDQRSAEQLAANYRAQEKAGQLIAEAQGPAFLGSTGLDPITAQNLYDARKQFSDQADKFLASLGFLRDSLEYGGHLAKEYLPSSPLYVRQNGSALILPDQPIHPSIFSFSTEPKGAGTTSVKVVDNIAEGTGGFLLGGSKLLRSVPWISGTVGVSLAGYDMYLYEQTGNTDYKASAVNQSAWTAADALVGVGAPFLALTPLGWAGAAVVGIGYGGYRLIDAFNDTQGSFWNAEGYTGDRLKEYFRK
jgi:hypothetical protein